MTELLSVLNGWMNRKFCRGQEGGLVLEWFVSVGIKGTYFSVTAWTVQ